MHMRRLTFLLALTLVLVACGSTPDAALTPTPGVAGSAILTAAQAQLAQAQAQALAADNAQAQAELDRQAQALALAQQEQALQVQREADAREGMRALASVQADILVQQERAKQEAARTSAVEADARARIARSHAIVDAAVRTGYVVTGLVALALFGLAVVTIHYRQERESVTLSEHRKREEAATRIAEARARQTEAEVIKAILVQRNGRDYMTTPLGFIELPTHGALPRALPARAARWVGAGRTLLTWLSARGKLSEPDNRRLAIVHDPDGRPNARGYRTLVAFLADSGVVLTSATGTRFASPYDVGDWQALYPLTHFPECPPGEPPSVRVCVEGDDLVEPVEPPSAQPALVEPALGA